MATRADRNNNPGNIKASKYTLAFPGVVGVEQKPAADGGNFLIFDSPESGLNAMKTLITSGNSYQGVTAEQAIKKWNGGGAYGAADVGLNPNQDIQLQLKDPNKLNSVVLAMAKAEGFSGGGMNEQDKATLAGVIQQMEAQGESPDAIRKVVRGFIADHGGDKGFTTSGNPNLGAGTSPWVAGSMAQQAQGAGQPPKPETQQLYENVNQLIQKGAGLLNKGLNKVLTNPKSIPGDLAKGAAKFAYNTATDLTGAKELGGGLAAGIIPHLGDVKAADQAETARSAMLPRLAQAIRDNKAKGKDTKQLEAQYKRESGGPAVSFEDINPNSTLTNNDIYGGALKMAGTVVGSGTYGKGLQSGKLYTTKASVANAVNQAGNIPKVGNLVSKIAPEVRVAPKGQLPTLAGQIASKGKDLIAKPASAVAKIVTGGKEGLIRKAIDIGIGVLLGKNWEN